MLQRHFITKINIENDIHSTVFWLPLYINFEVPVNMKRQSTFYRLPPYVQGVPYQIRLSPSFNANISMHILENPGIFCKKILLLAIINNDSFFKNSAYVSSISI